MIEKIMQHKQINSYTETTWLICNTFPIDKYTYILHIKDTVSCIQSAAVDHDCIYVLQYILTDIYIQRYR